MAMGYATCLQMKVAVTVFQRDFYPPNLYTAMAIGSAMILWRDFQPHLCMIIVIDIF